jgi:hypothetical protein
VVLAGSVAADPVQRRMPSGDEVTEVSPTGAEHDRLTGTFEERFKIAIIAIAPSLVMFNDNSSGDAALVDSMCPHDYTLRLWRFVVQNHARKQIRSDAFGDAFGKAEAQIEEQLALKGDVTG